MDECRDLQQIMSFVFNPSRAVLHTYNVLITNHSKCFEKMENELPDVPLITIVY